MSFVCVKNKHLKIAIYSSLHMHILVGKLCPEITIINHQRIPILRQQLKLALGAKEIDIYTEYEPNALPLMPNIYKLPESRMLSNGTLTEYELRFLRYTMYASVVK